MPGISGILAAMQILDEGEASWLTTRNISPASNSRKRDQRRFSCSAAKIGSLIGLPSRLACFYRVV
ncbi:MAG: hypothetical protein WCG31_05675 [Deltaproteobacteria bacterium]